MLLAVTLFWNRQSKDLNSTLPHNASGKLASAGLDTDLTEILAAIKNPTCGRGRDHILSRDRSLSKVPQLAHVLERVNHQPVLAQRRHSHSMDVICGQVTGLRRRVRLSKLHSALLSDRVISAIGASTFMPTWLNCQQQILTGRKTCPAETQVS